MKKIKVAALPRLLIEEGAFKKLPGIIASSGYGRVGIIHGRTVWNRWGDDLCREFNTLDIDFLDAGVSGEPSPRVVDDIVTAWADEKPELILAVGGGSVMDAAKAAAAMLAESGSGGTKSVKEFLEGVGSMTPSGTTLPLYAVPTTAGTGSEATKNAVLSEIGGFKKSLRHDNYVPKLALIDPLLAVDAPLGITVAAGLDAITQLIESFISTGAGPFTDSLAVSGLVAAGRALPALLQNLENVNARAKMGYAAYLSGVCLANAGLGMIHGAASPIGAAREIPHGLVCGLLLSGTIRRILMRARAQEQRVLVRKIEKAAEALNSDIDQLPELLDGWLEDSGLPGFGEYGFTEDELRVLAGETDMKNSPVLFSEKEIAEIFLERI
jgi:alcohol dehydrogenase class IV